MEIATIQRALDALISGDRHAAAGLFVADVAVTGTGGCLNGRTVGLTPVLARFAEMAKLTGGTFGTEVEAVYTGRSAQVVVIRHWARIGESTIHGSQALLVEAQDGLIREVGFLSAPGESTGIWD